MTPRTLVSSALEGYHEPMRLNKLRYKALLVERLPALASEYGARATMPANVLSACVEIVLDNFAYLGFGELDEAFKWAARADDNALTMYGGNFNATVLTKILTSYRAERSRVIEAYLQAQERERERLHAQKRKSMYDELFPEMVRDFTGELKDVPYFWHETGIRLGMLSYSPEAKREAWERGMEIARREVSSRIAAEKNPLHRNELNKLLEPDALQDRAVTWAKKILVFEHLLKPQHA